MSTKKASLRNALLDFDVGGLGEARLKAVRFGKYKRSDRNGDVFLSPDFGDYDHIQVFEPYYPVTGQDMLIRACNLYKSIPDDAEQAVERVTEWCLKNVHPYYPPELLNNPNNVPWDEHWLNLWGSGVGTFSVIDFIASLKTLFELAGAVMTLTLLAKGQKEEADRLYHGVFYDGSYDLYKEYVTQEHYSQDYLLHDNYIMLPKVSMKVEYDPESKLPIFMPEVASIFDVLNYTLIRMVTKNAPKMDEAWHKQSIALCECCGKMFIKQGNRQKYCKDPLCQAERKNRKARYYYQRKKDAKESESPSKCYSQS